MARARQTGLPQDSSQSFNNRVTAVLANPALFPPEFSAWVRSEIVRNPLVQIEPYQLPKLDAEHQVGALGQPAFQNAWANYGGVYDTLSFYKDNASRVWLQGLIAGGTVGTVIFTLPVGYRPVAQLVICVLTGGNTIGRVDIAASGNVTASAGNNGFFSLSGVSFRAL